MAKKQKRRSVSLNRTFYDRLKKFADAHGYSMSNFVETECGRRMDAVDTADQVTADRRAAS